MDKQLFTVFNLNQGSTQKNAATRVSTVAETFTSMHLTIGITKGSQSLDGIIAIAVVRQQEGAVLGTLSFADNGQIYSIDNDLLWGRYFAIPTGANAVGSVNINALVKAQRKLKIGDTIAIVLKRLNDNEAGVIIHSAAFYLQG